MNEDELHNTYMVMSQDWSEKYFYQEGKIVF